MNKRSKKGCLSCKKLRIKCDEALPRCEYCQHTNRECEYPEPTSKIPSKKRRTVAKVDKQEHSKSRKEVTVYAGCNSISQISSPDFERLICEHEDRSFDQFSFNQTLAKPHKQLSISKLEYRLLDFFHSFCIEKFKLAIRPRVAHIWENEVPSLFLRSRLVRCSIFSFAALNLNPLCDMNQLCIEEKKSDFFNRFEPDSNESALFRLSATKTQNIHHLQSVTMTYFLEATQLTNELIKDGLSTGSSDSVEDARQLAISAILMFAFLSMQPDNMTPLVSWDKSESDFISIANGMYKTVKHCIPILATSDFDGLFYAKMALREPPNITFPITRKLYKDIELEYPEGETTALERDDIIAAVDVLNMLINRSIGLGTPNPFFRWVMVISKSFRDLIYSKNFFALHTLFVYSALFVLMRFQLIGNDNLWLAYLRWFKQYNLDLFDGWKYPVDNILFALAHDELKNFRSYKEMAEFDPESFNGDDLFVV